MNRISRLIISRKPSTSHSKPAAGVGPTNPTTPTPPADSGHAIQEKLNKILGQLQLLANKHERVTSHAALYREQSPADLTKLYNGLEKVVDDLCEVLGLAEKDRPALPDKEKLLANPGHVMNDLRISSGRSPPAANPRVRFHSLPPSLQEIGDSSPSPDPTSPASTVTSQPPGLSRSVNPTPRSDRLQPSERAPSVTSLILPEPKVPHDEPVAAT